MISVNAKILKEMGKWTGKTVISSRIWCIGGWLYATDSTRIVRLHVGGEVPDCATVDPEVLARMTAKDAVVWTDADGVRLGKAFFPWECEEGVLKQPHKLFESNGEPGEMKVQSKYLRDLAALGIAAGGQLHVTSGRELRASVEWDGPALEAVVMGMRGAR